MTAQLQRLKFAIAAKEHLAHWYRQTQKQKKKRKEKREKKIPHWQRDNQCRIQACLDDLSVQSFFGAEKEKERKKGQREAKGVSLGKGLH